MYPLITHSSWLWVAPRSAASWPWATFSPETEAITAISAVHMAMRIIRRRRGSAIAPGVSWAGTEPARTVSTDMVSLQVGFRTLRYGIVLLVRDGTVSFVDVKEDQPW